MQISLAALRILWRIFILKILCSLELNFFQSLRESHKFGISLKGGLCAALGRLELILADIGGAFDGRSGANPLEPGPQMFEFH
jgi:hypothetical protein